MHNPFTVASVSEETGTLTLVARRMMGPVTNRLASLQSLDTQVAVNIDGPYGTAAYFPNLAGSQFHKVLLVAGGVGATFIMPLYEHILSENPSAQVQMVWAVKHPSEAAWSVLRNVEKVHNDGRIRLFLTCGGRESSSMAMNSSRKLSTVGVDSNQSL